MPWEGDQAARDHDQRAGIEDCWGQRLAVIGPKSVRIGHEQCHHNYEAMALTRMGLADAAVAV